MHRDRPMLPAVQHAVKAKQWKCAAYPLDVVRTAAERWAAWESRARQFSSLCSSRLWHLSASRAPSSSSLASLSAVWRGWYCSRRAWAPDRIIANFSAWTSSSLVISDSRRRQTWQSIADRTAEVWMFRRGDAPARTRNAQTMVPIEQMGRHG